MKSAAKVNKYLMTRVIAASLVLLVALFHCMAYVLKRNSEAVMQTCFQTLEHEANEVSRDLKATISDDFRLLNSLAGFIAMQEDLRSRAVRDLLASFDDSGMISRINLLYPDDQVLTKTGVLMNTDGVLSFEAERRLGEHVSDKSVSVLYPDRQVLRVFVPVPRGGETAALLYGMVELTRLAELFVPHAYDGEVELYVVDAASGDFLLDTWHKSLGNISMLYERQLTQGYDADAILADIAAGGKGYFSFVSKTIDEPLYMYYEPVGVNDWTIFLTVPESVVMAQPRALLYMLRMGAFLFALSLALYSLWIFVCYRRVIGMFLDAPAGVCILASDRALSILMANKAFYPIIGMSDKKRSRLRRESFLALLDENARETVLAQWSTILACSQTDFEFELAITADDGSERAILARIHYDRWHSKRLTVNVLDITARKRTEEELRLGKERYRLALAQNGKMFFLFDVPARTMHLPDELAQAFGLPCEVDNMPENPLSRSLVEPRSVENYRRFYARICAGEPSGDTVIGCHTRGAPEQTLWYKLAFTSVFDAQNAPLSAAITYEDLREKRAKEIADAWKQQNLVSLPEGKYVIAEYNLTENRLTRRVGELFAKLPESLHSYDEITAYALEHFLFAEDAPAYARFLDRARLLARFEAGETEDALEYRALQNGGAPRWTSVSLQMIRDPYSNDVLAQMVFTDIHAEKAGLLEMEQNVEALKRELENSRIKVMIKQMQPHFLYNALASIQILIKRDPNRAYALLRDFTIHLRGSIKALSSDAPIPFAEELNNVRAYLNIETMRLSDKLEVEYDIACEDFTITPLTIQPLVENAVKHGVFPKGEEGGKITLRSYETEADYFVEVQDDGMGCDAQAIFEEHSDSYGLRNLVFRLKSLLNAEVLFKSEIGAGTLVTVRIPKNAEKGTV